MSDTPDASPSTAESAATAEPAPTAGSLLRQARLAKGLHIAALATSIKVAPRKLELLEADRYDELPGATFTRALAQTVCRSLKIDAGPVLALLPHHADLGLAQLTRGLNEPFRDKPGRRVPSDLSFLKSPVAAAAVVLVVASVVLYVLPAGWVAEIARWVERVPAGAGGETGTAQTPSVESPVVTVLPSPEVVMAAPDAAPPDAVAAASASLGGDARATATASSTQATPAATVASAPAVTASSVPAGTLLLRAQAQSWIEVIDGRGNALLSRLLEAGETVGVDGPTPLRVRIGNASATQVSFRGRPVDLTPSRDNVAKLELR